MAFCLLCVGMLLLFCALMIGAKRYGGSWFVISSYCILTIGVSLLRVFDMKTVSEKKLEMHFCLLG